MTKLFLFCRYGGLGVISVLANIKPKETHHIVSLYQNGNSKESKDLQLELLPLIQGLFLEVNPIPVKEALNLLNFEVGNCRLPLTPLTAENKKKLQNLLPI